MQGFYFEYKAMHEADVQILLRFVSRINPTSRIHRVCQTPSCSRYISKLGTLSSSVVLSTVLTASAGAWGNIWYWFNLDETRSTLNWPKRCCVRQRAPMKTGQRGSSSQAKSVTPDKMSKHLITVSSHRSSQASWTVLFVSVAHSVMVRENTIWSPIVVEPALIPFRIKRLQQHQDLFISMWLIRLWTWRRLCQLVSRNCRYLAHTNILIIII